MYRRVISAVPLPQLDGGGNPTNPVLAMPPDPRAFYARINGQVRGCIDYITTQDAPADALYACEQRGPDEYVVTVEAPAGLVVPHSWAGWPEIAS